MKKINANVTVT